MIFGPSCNEVTRNEHTKPNKLSTTKCSIKLHQNVSRPQHSSSYHISTMSTSWPHHVGHPRLTTPPPSPPPAHQHEFPLTPGAPSPGALGAGSAAPSVGLPRFCPHGDTGGVYCTGHLHPAAGSWGERPGAPVCCQLLEQVRKRLITKLTTWPSEKLPSECQKLPKPSLF